MPIKIPNDLPAFSALEAEGVMVMREADAIRQDVHLFKIGLLNLMPDKIRTESRWPACSEPGRCRLSCL